MLRACVFPLLNDNCFLVFYYRKRKEIAYLIGKVDDGRFHVLVSLGKNITDHVTYKRASVAEGNQQSLPPRTCAKDKAIILYTCRHENHHFGKSRHLSDSLVSLFSQSLQKTAFSPLDIAHERHEQHLLLHHCCHSQIILFKAQIFVHAIVSITM